MKTTAYFATIRQRPDRSGIQDAWIERTIRHPLRETVQADGRIRRWSLVPEAGGRPLRVVLLPVGETVHCAITVGHASNRAGIPEFSIERVAA